LPVVREPTRRTLMREFGAEYWMVKCREAEAELERVTAALREIVRMGEYNWPPTEFAAVASRALRNAEGEPWNASSLRIARDARATQEDA
jgi:hypothetical protein